MKCPRCNGTGSVPYHIADDLFDETNCPLCGGSGEFNPNEVDRFNAVDFIKVMEMVKKPQTNEEWLKQCTTEQLATFLAIVQYDGTDLTLKKNHVEKWVEWLKEKHE